MAVYHVDSLHMPGYSMRVAMLSDIIKLTHVLRYSCNSFNYKYIYISLIFLVKTCDYYYLLPEYHMNQYTGPLNPAAGLLDSVESVCHPSQPSRKICFVILEYKKTSLS